MNADEGEFTKVIVESGGVEVAVGVKVLFWIVSTVRLLKFDDVGSGTAPDVVPSLVRQVTTAVEERPVT